MNYNIKNRNNQHRCNCCFVYDCQCVTFHIHAKVVGIMRRETVTAVCGFSGIRSQNHMETGLRIVVFRIGTGYFGIDIRKVKEIVSGTDKHETADKYPLNVARILNIHGNAVPMLDLHEKFHIKQKSAVSADIIVISSANKLLALPCDEIDRYYDVPFYDLNPLPCLIQNRNTLYFQQSANIDGMLVLLLDSERLFHEAAAG